MKPRLLHSPLTESVYIVTNYKDLGHGQFVANVKYDVTTEFMRIAQHMKSAEE